MNIQEMQKQADDLLKSSRDMRAALEDLIQQAKALRAACLDPSKGERVAIWGLYDCHSFHKIEGTSVDEVIENWIHHNLIPHPAIRLDGDEIELGKSCLCPAIVMNAENKEVRRVGNMVDESGKGLEEYRAALKADPDIERLLGERLL